MFSVLSQLILIVLVYFSSGQALAYLPDFALKESGLIRLRVSDCAYECVEEAHLVWRPDVASGWQNQLVSALSAPTKIAKS